MNLMPSCSSSLMRRITTSCLSSFILGMPYIKSPPGRAARSSTVTVWPARFNCCAAASPAGPEPTTATFLPVRFFGGSGTTQPSSKPRSIIAFSMFFIATGGLLMPRTHAPSQGAGQTRPVNSGKLLVLCRRCSASWYFAAVAAMTSSGKLGAGACLFQGWPSIRTCSSQSRTSTRKNCRRSMRPM